MVCTTFNDLRVFAAQQLRESVFQESSNSKLYLTFGKVESWANDSSPNVANTSVATVYEVWSNMIGGKRIVGSDISHAIPRIDWAANTVYYAYDNMNDDLHNANNQFYVMNSNYDVYKCIANNYGANSTAEPTSVKPSSVSITSDGYIWKYMYSLSDADQLRYMTDEYIPVRTLTGDDGSVQWQVQSNAIDGGIHRILIEDGGSDYDSAANITITISGDGSSATATASINTSTNTVNSVLITNPGSGYTYATVTITDAGSGSGANLRAIISPPGGHGSDPLYELGGKNLMFNVRVRYDEEGVLPITNDFRQVALIKDPYSYGTSNVATASAFLQAEAIIVQGTGDYDQDEIVYQGASLAASTYSGRVLSWDSSNNKLLLINTKGNATASRALIGSSSFTIRNISSVEYADFEKNTGKLLYINNISPVTRSEEQIENYQILVKF